MDVLWDALEVANAWRMLHDPNVSGNLDTEGIYDLTLAAGYTKAQAEKAAKARALARMEQELPP